jgi:YD repeat-containing protein
MTVEYDKLNRLTKTTYPDLTTTRVVYNSIGRQSAMFDRELSAGMRKLGRKATVRVAVR